MSPLDWFKKEKPMLSMQSMGGGAAGLMISGTSEPIVASGGTKSTPGDGFIYHVFTSSGSLVVTQGKGSEFNCLIVGGGGGGGFDRGGGGGAGGLFNGTGLVMGAAGTYPVSIGGGGPGNTIDPVPSPDASSARGVSGGGSSTPLAPTGGVAGGGGGGGEKNVPDGNFKPGHSRSGASGGGGHESGDGGTGTNPNTGAGTYGYPGHKGEGGSGGGGGGAGISYTPNTGPPYPGDAPTIQRGAYGGFGKEIPWVPGVIAGRVSPTGTAWFAGGGFGGGSNVNSYPSPSPTPQMDYRFAGAARGGSNPGQGDNGLANTGSGGGGGGWTPAGSRKGGAGGSGVVVVRYAE